jgi:hypothetical protein
MAMNRTDQFSDDEILQGMRNFQAVARIGTDIRNSLERRDPMWLHFDKVIAFCNERAAEARKLLEEPRVRLTDG